MDRHDLSAAEGGRAPPERRLVVLGIGNDQSRNPILLPPVPFADRDAERLADTLARHLVTADGKRITLDRQGDRNVLTGVNASAKSIGASLDELGRRIEAQKLRKGDIVAIVIASNVLHFGKDTVIAAADTVPSDDSSAANPTISARDVSELLGRVADYGCRVVVFLDGVHQLPEKSFDNTIKPWVRDLQRNRRVITFVASKEGPSLAGDARSRGCSPSARRMPSSPPAPGPTRSRPSSGSCARRSSTSASAGRRRGRSSRSRWIRRRCSRSRERGFRGRPVSLDGGGHSGRGPAVEPGMTWGITSHVAPVLIGDLGHT